MHPFNCVLGEKFGVQVHVHVLEQYLAPVKLWGLRTGFRASLASGFGQYLQQVVMAVHDA